MNSEYVLVSRWTLSVSREDLWDVLDELLGTDDPMAWWPSVRVTAYDGDTMTVRASSVFGYALTFSLADLATRRPDALGFTSIGDLRGRGEVTFTEATASSTSMDIDWRVATDRRWMRLTGWLLRPVFVLGHHLVMRQGQKHLRRWLDEKR